MKELLLTKDVSSLNENERIKLIHSLGIDDNAWEYLKIKLQNLHIEILGDYEGNILDLMCKGRLEGWCWQTTESAIVFLEDSDYIERGNLKFSKHKKYWHSWICFKLDDKIFVFDPCLQILVEQYIYNYVFEVCVEGSTTSKEVREDLIFRINSPKKKSYDVPEETSKFLNYFFSKYASERQKSETHISGDDNVNSPMYRNNTGYTATIEDGKIINLIAHYYLNG